MDEFFGGEYDKLCADGRVQSLSVTESGIVLTTRVVWNRTLYLGLHEICIDFGRSLHKSNSPGKVSFNVYCIQSGRHDGSRQLTYPLASGLGGFCFGNRTESVKKLFEAGEFFALLVTTLDSLWFINEPDVGRFILQYRTVLPDNTIEPVKKGQPSRNLLWLLVLLRRSRRWMNRLSYTLTDLVSR